MTTENFNKAVEAQILRCTDILCKKASEYATEDRLHNFKNAAGMMGCDPKEALAGMMAKHTISIYDMCRSGRDDYPLNLWEEKITDHINYLLLLKALVVEEINDKIANAPMGSFQAAPLCDCTTSVAPPYNPEKYAAYMQSGGTSTHIIRDV